MIRFFMMLAVLCGYAGHSIAAAPGDHRTLMVDGTSRHYQIYVPTQVAAAHRAVVILLHDSGNNASSFRHYTEFDNVAGAAGIIAVYPQAHEDNWSQNTNDSAFLENLIKTLIRDEMADPDRVYIGGLAAGGILALRFACEHTDMVAGLALVAATAPAELNCKPSRAIPVIALHGTADHFNPIEGGNLLKRGGAVEGQALSLDDTLAEWLEIDGCSKPKIRPLLGVRLHHDGLTLERTTYRECTEAPVESIIIKGGGHTWPGAEQNFFTNQVFGPATRQIDAGAMLWAFFQAAENDPE